MNRYVWFSLLLMLIASISTIFMLKNNNKPESGATTAELNVRPDAFMVHANYYEYDDKGLLHSHLVAKTVTHFPHKNTAQFTQPNLILYHTEHQPWYISADHGISRNGIGWVYLWHHVRLYQPPETKNLATTITTNSVTILPEESLAETSEKVTIKRPNSIVKATGMKANFKTNIVELLSQSTGFYEAETPP